jgi:hypothetical protein
MFSGYTFVEEKTVHGVTYVLQKFKDKIPGRIAKQDETDKKLYNLYSISMLRTTPNGFQGESGVSSLYIEDDSMDSAKAWFSYVMLQFN